MLLLVLTQRFDRAYSYTVLVMFLQLTAGGGLQLTAGGELQLTAGGGLRETAILTLT